MPRSCAGGVQQLRVVGVGHFVAVVSGPAGALERAAGRMHVRRVEVVQHFRSVVVGEDLERWAAFDGHALEALDDGLKLGGVVSPVSGGSGSAAVAGRAESGCTARDGAGAETHKGPHDETAGRVRRAW